MPFRPRSVIIHPDASVQYEKLERSAAAGSHPDGAAWKKVGMAFERVRADGQWGEVIPKSQIPLRFVQKYGVTNLYCVDLPSFRRCSYTILGRDVIFLDIVDHRKYDRLFRS